MSGQQRAVLWIGLILVGLNLVQHWPTIKQVIFTGAGITSGIPGSSGGGFSVPNPFLIGPRTIPLATPQHQTKNVQIMLWQPNKKGNRAAISSLP
jgi:hypothetical protein